MKRKIQLVKSLIFSATARDTFILFGGNVGTAFWGFLFTLIVARSLSVYDFGVFSAVLNMVVIITSVTDLGISSGVINFVANNWTLGQTRKVDEYVKASFLLRSMVTIASSFLVLIFARFISVKFLASSDPKMGIWVSVITLFWILGSFFPYILQAKKMFLASTIYDNSFYLSRLIFILLFYTLGSLSLDLSFWAFGAGFVASLIFTFIYVKFDFLKSKPTRKQYGDLLKFSGWIGVSRVVSSISGRIDVQMLAAMLGAVATGLYSIPSRLASFIAVLAGSFSSVLATRLASFNDKEKEKKYIIKSTLALIPISLGIIFWIVIAEPFILILFGNKYLPAVPIFQALVAAQIPFLLTAPATSAIIYSMKKTVYVGALSFIQMAFIFLLNLYLIPKYGVFGPTITLGAINVFVMIYLWFFVIRYYWFKK